MRICILLTTLLVSACAVGSQEDEPTIVTGRLQPLAIANKGGKDMKWSSSKRRNIRYCVERGFAGRYGGFGVSPYNAAAWVEDSAKAAEKAWEAIADVGFDFVPGSGCSYCDPRVTVKDALCTTAKPLDVDFAIIPFMDIESVTTQGEEGSTTVRKWVPAGAAVQAIARTTFVPGLIIDGNFQAIKVGSDIFEDSSPTHLSETFVHEFGHVLGFLHEHQRSDVPQGLRGGKCTASMPETSPFDIRNVTAYDRLSTMHNPAVGLFNDCGGRTDGMLYELSFMDKMGAPCIYGEPGSGRIPDYCNVLTAMPSVESAFVGAITPIIDIPVLPATLDPIIIYPTYPIGG